MTCDWCGRYTHIRKPTEGWVAARKALGERDGHFCWMDHYLEWRTEVRRKTFNETVNHELVDMSTNRQVY